ncbi:hypothetical protein [Moorella sp. E306M]|uniref:hypothetical protein n=1 Tax=Moorella sp. E306M TaxID=2572683 RepID=UPI0010FFAE08|nr:hypothetical protein [Moorella sp. E306M]GEA19256.1 hypothetical protein E306M_23940 [Moorella sp. E306M]
MSFVRCLECPRCHSTYTATEIHNLCQCGSPLLVRYDLERLGQAVKKEDLKSRRADLWRYWEFLPLRGRTGKTGNKGINVEIVK